MDAPSLPEAEHEHQHLENQQDHASNANDPSQHHQSAQSYDYPHHPQQYQPQHHHYAYNNIHQPQQRFAPPSWPVQPQAPAAAHPRLNAAAAAALAALSQLSQLAEARAVAEKAFDMPPCIGHAPMAARSSQYGGGGRRGGGLYKRGGGREIGGSDPLSLGKKCDRGTGGSIHAPYDGKSSPPEPLVANDKVVIDGEGGPSAHAPDKAAPVEVPSVILLAASSARKVAAKREPKQASRCEICSLDCSSLKLLEEHTNGKRHRMNMLKIERLKNIIIPKPAVQSEQNLAVESISEVSQQPETQQNCEKNKVIEDLTFEAGSDRNQAEVKEQNYNVSQSENPAVESSDLQMMKPKDDQMVETQEAKRLKTCGSVRQPIEPSKPKQAVRCEICSVDCPNLKELEIHTNGKRHKTNMLKIEQAVRCEICSLDCSTLKLLEEHTNGKRHKMNMLKIERLKKIIIPKPAVQNEQKLTVESISEVSQQPETQKNCEKNKVIEGLTFEAGSDRNQAEVKEQNYNVSQSENSAVESSDLQMMKPKDDQMVDTQEAKRLKTCGSIRQPIEPSKPKQAVRCEICSVDCPNLKELEIHTNGKRHKTNMLKIEQAVRCEICSLDCSTLKLLEEHTNGKRHKMNMLKIERLKKIIIPKPAVQSEQKLTVESISEVSQQPETQQNCEKNKVIEGLTFEAGGVRNQAEAKEQNYTVSQSECLAVESSDLHMMNVMEDQTKVKPKQASWCEICSINCGNLKSLENHTNGKRHKTNMLKIEGLKHIIIPKPAVQSELKLTVGSISEVPQQPGSQQNCEKGKLIEGLTVETGGVRNQAEAKEQNYTVSQSECLAVESSDLHMMNVMEDQTKVKPKQTSWCEICSINCGNLKSLENHTNGKRHKTNMLKIEGLKHIIIPKPAVQSELKLTVGSISEVPQQPGSQQNCEKGKLIEGLTVETGGVRNQAEAKEQNYTVSQSECLAVESSDMHMMNVMEDQTKVKPKQTSWCEICSINCGNLKSLENHTNGKRHKTNMLKIEGLKHIIIPKPAVQSDTKPTVESISEVPQQPGSQQNCEMNKVIEGLTVEAVGVRNQAEANEHNYPASQSECPAVESSDLQMMKLKEDQISNKKGRKKRKMGDTQEEAKKRLKTCESVRQPLENLVCDLCNVKCKRQGSMDNHLSGKKHIAKLNSLGGQQALSGPTGQQVLDPPNPIVQTILHPQDRQHPQSSFPPPGAYMPPQAPHQAPPAASGIDPQFQSIPQTHGSVATLDAGCQSAVTMIQVAQQAQLATTQPGIV